MKITSLFFGTFFLTSALFAAPLPDTKAPFRRDAALKPYKGKMSFDPKTMIYTYGDKQLVVTPNSSYSISSGGREISKGIFYVATMHRSMQNVNCPKADDSFRGYLMNIRNVKIQGDSITFTGKVPWKGPGEEYISGDWKISYTPVGNARIKVKYQFAPPEGYQFKDTIVFIKFMNVKMINAGKYGRWEYGKKFPLSVNKMPSEILVECPDPADNFKIHAECRWHNHVVPTLFFLFENSSGYSFGEGATCEYTIDLSNSYVRKTVKAPGGVDFATIDQLHVPDRGKNMFPNPYIAEKLMYFHPYNISAPSRYAKLSTDAKFGRYSLYANAFYTPAIPLDAGDYVLSYYVKGKGSIWSRYYPVANRARYPKPFIRSINSPDQWSRQEFPFTLPKNTAINFSIHSQGLLFDGFQLEKGKKATAFEAPKITAGPGNDFFFEHGTNIKLPFEFSTLEKSVSADAVFSVKNFYGEPVFSKPFKVNLNAGQYPKQDFSLGKLPDGIYIAKIDYGTIAPTQYFRFSVMPFLKNTHTIAKAFSLYAYGHVTTVKEANEMYLARLQKIGVGAEGHSAPMTKEVLDLYAKYNVIPFDVGYEGRNDSIFMKKAFPELKNVPGGHTWFLVQDLDKRDPKTGYPEELLPDYRLVGGWSREYKEKFMNAIREQVRRYPQRKAYRFASEWAHEIKDDPHYPDLFAAYCEAVKSVYPTAWVYEAGDTNMDVDNGTAYYDKLLTRLKGKAKTDFASAHTYTKNISEIYTNFRTFVEMLNRHKELGRVRIALPEGMSFQPYHVPAWGTELIAWSGEGWGIGVLSYDLGWSEKISGAYHARAWLSFLTEYDRLWAACSFSENVQNVVMDHALTPRVTQKIPNTLGTLLGNPKAYLGDYTFAPETKCLVWKDEKDRPIAAVWNETELVNSGVQDSPTARFSYRGAEYFDLMGAPRKPAVDGEFPVSPFPLFIRGRAGDSKAFTAALSRAALKGKASIPCRLSFELKSADTLSVTLKNPLAKQLQGSLTVFNKQYAFRIAKSGTTDLQIKLQKPLRKGTVSKLSVPYVCKVGDASLKGVYSVDCFAVPKFTGNWSKVPAVKMTNSVGKKVSAKDLSATYQFAWDAKKLHMRVQVTDDHLNAGTDAKYRKEYDLLKVCFDTRCTALKYGKKNCDDDDYEYAFMPSKDGKKCDVWRILSPDMQLTLGTAAPKNNTIATEIPAKLIRTKNGYIYDVEFPADFILPARLIKGSNIAVGLYVADRDQGKTPDHGLSNAVKAEQSGQGQPLLWPVMVFTE